MFSKRLLKTLKNIPQISVSNVCKNTYDGGDQYVITAFDLTIVLEDCFYYIDSKPSSEEGIMLCCYLSALVFFYSHTSDFLAMFVKTLSRFMEMSTSDRYKSVIPLCARGVRLPSGMSEIDLQNMVDNVSSDPLRYCNYQYDNGTNSTPEWVLYLRKYAKSLIG